MKVWNLTDVPTSALEEQRLINVAIIVEEVVLQPGAGLDVPAFAEHHIRVEKSALINAGALCLGDPPTSYRDVKASAPVVPAKVVKEPESDPLPAVLEEAPAATEAQPVEEKIDFDDRPKKKKRGF